MSTNGSVGIDRLAAGWRWTERAQGGGIFDEKHPQRRVHSPHDLRLDGLTDLLSRAHGASVFDIGCNRGHVGYEFAINGARLVHGCDIHAASVQVARHWFSELPHCSSQFEIVNLEEGPAAIDVFGQQHYDIVLFIGMYHKLSRAMDQHSLSRLVQELGKRAVHYFAWTGFTEHFYRVDSDLRKVGLSCCHKSELAVKGRPAAIWRV